MPKRGLEVSKCEIARYEGLLRQLFVGTLYSRTLPGRVVRQSRGQVVSIQGESFQIVEAKLGVVPPTCYPSIWEDYKLDRAHSKFKVSLSSLARPCLKGKEQTCSSAAAVLPSIDYAQPCKAKAVIQPVIHSGGRPGRSRSSRPSLAL